MQCFVIALLRRYLRNIHGAMAAITIVHQQECKVSLPSPHHAMPNEIHITNSIKIKMKIIHNSKAITTELLKLSCEYEFRALHPSLLIQRNLCNSTSYLLLSLLLLLLVVLMFISLTISLLRSFVRSVFFSFFFVFSSLFAKSHSIRENVITYNQHLVVAV